MLRYLERNLPAAATALARCRRGITALESALVLPPFFVLTFGIFEITTMSFAAATLEGQVGEAARQIRTGAVQSSGSPAATFSTLLCADLSTMMTCGDAVIDVRRFDDFGDINYPDFVDSDGAADNNQFLPGGPGDVVLVRVAYRWKFMTPLIGHLLGDGASNSKQMVSTSVFMNEPFGNPASG